MAITNNFDTAVLALVDDITTAERVDISNAIFEAAFEIGNIADNHNVLTGVRNGNVIPILSTNPAYDSFPYKNPADCNIPACDLDLDFAAKAWELGMIACKIPICINTFNENFLTFWRSYKRLFGDEDLDSALMRFIIDRFQTNLQAAMWRVIWFGDTSTDSGDPNYPLLRATNGIFTQAEAMDGIKVEITQNATNNLTGEQIYAYLTDAYTTGSILPWWDSTVRIEMTQAMAAVYVAWLNSLGDKSPYQCECYAADGITAMRNFSVDANLRFAGIPIHVHREFDGVIQALGLGRPYRALITSSNNIIIGTSELDQLPAFDIWYSKDDDQIYIKGGAQLGAALVTNDYIYLGAENSGS